MRIVNFTFIVSVGLTISVKAVFAQESPDDIEATLAALRSQSGSAYATDREQLLSLPPEAVGPKLRAMKQKPSNPMDDLVWDALLIRLKDRQDDDSILVVPKIKKVNEPGETPVRRTIRLKVEFAIDEALWRAGLDWGPIMRKPPEPGDPPVRRPGGGTAVLIRYLGDDALPIAAELLYKGLADDWEVWEREMLLMTFLAFRSTAKGSELPTIKDPRAGMALLWMAQHDPDKELAKKATQYLPEFADPKLLKAAQAARDSATDEERRRLLAKGAENIDQRLQWREELRERLEREAATQPGD